MYHRYCINIKQNPIDGAIVNDNLITKLVREVLIERFTDVLYFSLDDWSRTYRIHNATATVNLFQFTTLSKTKLDFPENTNYFREYLREAFMQTLAKKLSETHIVQIYNYNNRSYSNPDPSTCTSFMQFMRNRFRNNEKQMRAAKKEYLKTIHGSDELRNIYSSLEGGLSSLI